MQVTIDAKRLRELEGYERLVLGANNTGQRVKKCQTCGEFFLAYFSTRAICSGCSRHQDNERDRHVLGRQLYREAIRTGRLTPKDKCSDCGGAGPIHGHHEDVAARPYDVEWLCAECHGDRHPEKRAFVMSATA